MLAREYTEKHVLFLKQTVENDVVEFVNVILK